MCLGFNTWPLLRGCENAYETRNKRHKVDLANPGDSKGGSQTQSHKFNIWLLSFFLPTQTQTIFRQNYLFEDSPCSSTKKPGIGRYITGDYGLDEPTINRHVFCNWFRLRTAAKGFDCRRGSRILVTEAKDSCPTIDISPPSQFGKQNVAKVNRRCRMPWTVHNSKVWPWGKAKSHWTLKSLCGYICWNCTCKVWISGA